MSIFERKLSFLVLHFLKNNHKSIAQQREWSGGTVSFTAGPWQSPSGASGG